MIEININPKQLYEGCIQAALTHAIAVGMYPELNHEHSWDGINYCTNDSQSCRATITFHDIYIIAVFQAIDKVNWNADELDFFDGAPKEIIEIAEKETLQYVLDSVEGSVKPVVTAAFWGTWDKLNSAQSFDSIVENGGHIIRSQLLSFNDAMDEWRDYLMQKALEELQNSVDTVTYQAFYMLVFQKRTIAEVSAVTRKTPNTLYGIRSRCTRKLKSIITTYRQFDSLELPIHSHKNKLPY